VSTIIAIPPLDALPDTPDGLLSWTNDDGRAEILLDIDPSYTPDEVAWLVADVVPVLAREVAAIKVVRHAEDIARRAVLA
jgi:hypothetical protein